MITRSRGLRIGGGVGAALACGVAGVVVATDPRPASAPRHPAVGSSGPATTAAGSSSAPPPTACGGATTRMSGRAPRCVASSRTPAPTVLPAVVDGGVPVTPVAVTGAS